MKLEKEVVICGITTYRGSENKIEFVCNINDNSSSVEDKLLKMQRKKNVKLTLSLEEPILDEAERKYLSGVIKPFRDSVKYIRKTDYLDESEYLTFHMTNEPNWTMPLLKKGTMYKGMELDKEYTLEELEL